MVLANLRIITEPRLKNTDLRLDYRAKKWVVTFIRRAVNGTLLYLEWFLTILVGTQRKSYLFEDQS